MHEFSLMNDLMRKIETLAREHQAERVVSVKVRLGAMAHISTEHFAEHFAHAASGTVAEGARLEIEASSDPTDPLAQEIVLESVEVEG